MNNATIGSGSYQAVVESAEIAVSTKAETPCFRAVVRITEEGPCKGLRLPWEGWLTPSAAERSVQSLMIAGCTFPPLPGSDEPDLNNFEGLGTVEVSAQVELEDFTPPATETNPNPKTTSRPRVAFINEAGRGRSTKSVSAEQRAAIARQFAGVVQLVRAQKESNGDASFDPDAIEAAPRTAAAAAAPSRAAAVTTTKKAPVRTGGSKPLY